jgi:hypothetical protein
MAKSRNTMVPQFVTLSFAAGELKVDRRKLAEAMAGIPPEGKTSTGREGWLLATIARAAFASDGSLDLTQERARLAKAQADAQEIKSAILKGDVALRSDVDRAVGAAFTRVKARLRAVAPKLAPVVVAATGPAEAQAMILTAIDEALLELAETTVADLCGDDGGLVAAAEAAAEDDGEPVG